MSFLDSFCPLWGPNIKRRLERRINLSGTSIILDVPDNNDYPCPEAEPESQAINLYDLNYSRWESTDHFESERFGLLGRAWQYKRRLIGGNVADVRMNISVFRMPEFQSLFRPRRLECAVERLIFATPNFSTQESGKNRLNWQIAEGSNRWVQFEYKGETALYGCKEHMGVVRLLPLSDEHLLSVVFRFIYYSDSEIARKKCLALMDTIMASFRLTLSEDAIRQKNEVEKLYPYEKISAHLPPYEFETVKVLSEWEIADKVGEQLNHDFPDGFKQLEKLCAIEEAKQELKIKEVREHVLESHMRFEELERQDYEKYIFNK
jgi:hypothetical protein